MLKVGIVGLPNVGKSSLFNALTSAGAPSENYPFCTVEPNVGTVEVPDPRLDQIHGLTGSSRKVPTVIQFVDIAGLVKGASEGEGLGNQFLATIREVDAIAHVLRCFENEDIAHVDGSVDPVRDREVVEMELLLSDLDMVERRLEKVVKKARSGEKEAVRELAVLEKAKATLDQGRLIRTLALPPDEQAVLKGFQLLTAKPTLYVVNVGEGDLPRGENRFSRALEAALEGQEDVEVVPLCSAIESEISELDTDEQQEFLAELGLEGTGLDRLIRSAYHLLGLLTFFTTGEKESRAWTVRQGSRAPQAAGTIHSDFERGFIRAETMAYEDFVACGSEKKARELGKVRSEGKDYVVKDADIMLFRFNV